MESEKKTSLTKGHNEHFAVFLLHKKLMWSHFFLVSNVEMCLLQFPGPNKSLNYNSGSHTKPTWRF